MKSKTVKSIIYFIFSAVFISSTAFFINNNSSLRIYISTLLFVLRNYTWAIILFSQFIYIYRIDNLNIKNILFFSCIVVVIYLFLHSLMGKIDYTSLGRNINNELYIVREDIVTFNLNNYSFIRDLIFKVRKYQGNLIIFFVNPVLLLFIKEKTGKSSFFSSLFFIVLILVYILTEKILFTEFYILLLFLTMKFRGINENH